MEYDPNWRSCAKISPFLKAYTFAIFSEVRKDISEFSFRYQTDDDKRYFFGFRRQGEWEVATVPDYR